MKQRGWSNSHSLARLVALFILLAAAAAPRVLPPAGEARGTEERGEIEEAMRERFRQRAYPFGRIDPGAYIRAAEQRDQMRQAVPEGSRATAYWQFVGPQSIRPSYQQYNGPHPVIGRVNALAFHPSIAGTFYLGAAGGGVWKTTNAGGSWTSVSTGTRWRFQQVSSLAVDPVNSILYAGTGDFHNAEGQVLAHGFGLMKSPDGGTTWYPPRGAAQFGDRPISKILIDPADHNQLFVTCGRAPGGTLGGPLGTGQVWRSRDAGETWTSAIPVEGHWTNVVAGAPATTGRYYYASGIAPKGLLYRATSADGPFSPLTVTYPGMSPALSQRLLIETQYDVACSPTNPRVLYLLFRQLYQVSGSTTVRGDVRILKSGDAGATWVDRTAGFPHGQPGPSPPGLGAYYNWSQASYDYFLACSKRRITPTLVQDIVYVGLIDVAQSQDSGATWRSIGGPTYAAGTDAKTHNDQHCLAVNPVDPADLLLGNDGGVYRVNAPGTAFPTLSAINSNLGISQVYKVALPPRDPLPILAGAQDNGTPSLQTGIDAWHMVTGGDGGDCAIHPEDPRIQYGSYVELDPIYRTQDYWETPPQELRRPHPVNPVAFIAPVVLDPANPDLLYAADACLHRWDAETGAWTSPVSTQRLAGPNHYVQCIALSPNDNRRIYTGSSDGQVWMSKNRGRNWTRISSAATPNRAVTRIVVPPGDPDLLLVGYSGIQTTHLWQCTKASTAPAWASVSAGLPDIPLNAIAVDPLRPLTDWYAGTDLGVFRTQNAGGAWTNATVSLGLPNVEVDDLQTSSGFLYAATFGRGIWRLALPAAPTYVITEITHPDALYLQPETLSLNERGDVAGTMRTSSGWDRGFMWEPATPNGTTGTARDLGTPGGVTSKVVDVNDTGHFCGVGFTSANQMVVHRDNVPLSSPGVSAQAWAMNNAGTVAGYAYTGGNSHGTKWPGSLDLHAKMGLGGSSSAAYGINDREQVVGVANLPSGYTHAVLYPDPERPTAALDLGRGYPALHSVAWAVNNSGQAVGWLGPSGSDQRPVLWQDGRTRFLDPDSTRKGAALGVNDLGWAVGYSPHGKPCLWRNGTATDLTTKIPPSSGWQLSEARRINKKGQILAWANRDGRLRHVLLTPR